MEYEVKSILGKALYNDVLRITDGDTDFTLFKNKTVLITGASKLTGYYAVCSFLAGNDLYSNNVRVVAVDSDERLFELYGKLTYRQDIDLIVSRDYSSLTTNKTDFVIHTEDIDDIDGTRALLNLLDFIRRNRAVALLLSKSDIYGSVYNGRDTIFEADMGYCDPAEKSCRRIQLQRMAESLALSLCRDGVDIRLGRICRVFGYKKSYAEDGVEDILRAAMNGTNLVIDMKKSLPQSFIYPSDAVEAIFRIIENGEPAQIFNIASGYFSSNFQVANECVSLFSDKELKLVRQNDIHPLSPMAPTLPKLDIGKLSSLGFESKTDLRSGIKRSCEIIKEGHLC